MTEIAQGAATAGTPILTGSGVGMNFGGVTALKNVNFAVYQGEILGLIGPNGAGKTTLLSLISGVLAPSTGTLHYKGEVLNGRRAHQISRMGIGRTFQITKPFGGLTVRENVSVGALFGGRTRLNMKQALSRADEVLQDVDLWERRDSLASELNIAGLKRLELARTLATGSDLILLDEVMAGLNSTEVERMMELVQKVNRGGKTVIFVEHVMRAILGICHRVVVLHYGEKLAEGPPQAIIRDERVIQAYLGNRGRHERQQVANGSSQEPSPTTAAVPGDPQASSGRAPV